MATIIKFPASRVRPESAQGESVCVGNTVLRFPGAEPAPAPAPVPESVAMPAPTSTPEPPKSRKGNAAKREAHRKDMLAKKSIALNGNKKLGIPGLYQTLEGFTEEVYRAALWEKWGVESAADMNNDQLHGLLLWFAGLGFKFKSRKGNRKIVSREDRIDRITELLQERADAMGEEKPNWGYAMNILKRSSKGEATNFNVASTKLLDAVIAALTRNARYAKRGAR